MAEPDSPLNSPNPALLAQTTRPAGVPSGDCVDRPVVGPSNEDLLRRLDGVEGWRGDNEALLLYRLARQCSGAGVIVEIGSWKGRSTICLALGSLAGKRVRVYAVDPHNFGPDCVSPTDRLTTFGEFRANIKRAGVAEIVHPIVATSEAAVRAWRRPIEFLWIDGDHSYEAVTRDILQWTPHLVDGGTIAFDDSTPNGELGVRRAVSERVLASPYFGDAEIVGTITCAAKRARRQFSARNWALLMTYRLFDLGRATVPQRVRASWRTSFFRTFWRTYRVG